MKAELLNYRPLSGEYKEQWFDAIGECQSVLFETEDSECWLGVFGNGRIVEFSGARLFPIGHSAFVVAKGLGYVVDVNTASLSYKTESDFITGFIGVPSQDLIIACGFANLYALSSEGQVWENTQVPSDEIKFETATENQITGKVWSSPDHQWFPFQLDLENWQFRTKGSEFLKRFDG